MSQVVHRASFRSTSSQIARVGDVIDGKYRVDSVLGSGGMGMVLGAFHLQLRQPVALKFLHPSAASDEVTRARFDREARSLAQLESEHVARIMDVEERPDGTPFLVLEYLTGTDLGQELNRRGALEQVEAVDWMLQACEAMAEVHAAGIIHRDLKPENLFLAERADGSRIVKIIDFGVSKVTSDSGAFNLNNDAGVTRTMNLVGSPMYMSPEQLRSARDVDARTDVWSLGVTLYELLCCRPPFPTGTVPEVCASVLKDPIIPLKLRKSGLPEGLLAAVTRALSKEPADRFPDVASFAEAIAPFGSELAAARAMGLSRIRRRPFRLGSLPLTTLDILEDDHEGRASTVAGSLAGWETADQRGSTLPAPPPDAATVTPALGPKTQPLPFVVPRPFGRRFPGSWRVAAAAAACAALALAWVGVGSAEPLETNAVSKVGPAVLDAAAHAAADARRGDGSVAVAGDAHPAEVVAASVSPASSPAAADAVVVDAPSKPAATARSARRAAQARYFEYRK